MATVLKSPMDSVAETHYKRYAVAVNEDRAIPCEIDGLKPVNRRGLWALFTQGSTSKTRYEKASAFVGECFVAGTMIETTRGLIPIEQVKKGDIVFHDQGKDEVTETFVIDPRETMILELEDGTKITATPEQIFYVIDEGGIERERKLSELKPGDKLLVK